MWLPCTAPAANGKLMVSGQRLAGSMGNGPSLQSSVSALMYCSVQVADQSPCIQAKSTVARCLGTPPVTEPTPEVPAPLVVVPESSWLLVPVLPKASVATYCLVKLQSRPSLKSPRAVDGNL